MTFDQTMYLVISNRADGPIIYEIELARMGRSEVSRDIRHGQYPNVMAVIELDPKNQRCREVTHDFQALINGRLD